METFYKITKEQAALIGRFEYAPNQMVDPFVGEQKDGSYLVSELVYNMLKDRPEIKKVDFTKCEKISENQLDTKPAQIK